MILTINSHSINSNEAREGKTDQVVEIVLEIDEETTDFSDITGIRGFSRTCAKPSGSLIHSLMTYRFVKVTNCRNTFQLSKSTYSS